MKFKIRRGRHFSDGVFNKIRDSIHTSLAILKNREIKFFSILTDSCVYIDTQNPRQINKLCGIYNIHPYYESVRFGWRNVGENRIEILGFVHSNSIFDTIRAVIFGKPRYESFSLGEIKTNQEALMEISIKDNFYHMKILLEHGYNYVIIKRKKKILFPFWLKSFPYFGGKMPAPHDMLIYLKSLKR